MLADWELRVLHRNSQVAIFLPIKFPLETSLLQYIPVTQLFEYENNSIFDNSAIQFAVIEI